MAQQREHHFVSRFYLRQFSADGRRINLFNFARMRPFAGASIRGQCARRSLYDFAPELEQSLSSLESDTALAIREVRNSRRAPRPGSPQSEILLGFLVFQKLRTVAAGRKNDATTDYLAKLWAQGHPEFREMDLDEFEIRNVYPVALPLSQVGHVLEIASDLEVHLFVNDTELPFVTSDDPVVLHNRYCEGIDYRGVLGWNCAGIQAFWPISPSELLLFYDPDVYRVGRLNREQRETTLSSVREISLLNLLQILNADQNLYYVPERGKDTVLSQCHRHASKRPAGRTTFVETEEVAAPDGGTSSLIHTYERLLPIRLNLDSIGLRKRARRVPMDRRATLFRRDLPRRPEDERFYDREPIAGRYAVKRVFER